MAESILLREAVRAVAAPSQCACVSVCVWLRLRLGVTCAANLDDPALAKFYASSYDDRANAATAKVRLKKRLTKCLVCQHRCCVRVCAA